MANRLFVHGYKVFLKNKYQVVLTRPPGYLFMAIRLFLKKNIMLFIHGYRLPGCSYTAIKFFRKINIRLFVNGHQVIRSWLSGCSKK